jgi:hypothetical protein
MTDDETEVEETVMLTRRDRRRSGAVADPATQPAEAETAVAADVEAGGDDSVGVGDVDEATVVVDRRPEAVEGSDDDPDEATVVVDRSSSSAEAPADVLEVEQEQEQEHMLLEEPTVVVSRTPRRLRRKRSDRSDDQSDTSVEPASAGAPLSFEAPTDAPAPAIYRPRPAPLGPSAPPVVIGAAAPTRTVDPELPSVAKQGLRWSMTTLVAFAAACVVSVAGLVALGFVVFT